MRISRIGRTGLKVSEICLGTMTFGGRPTRPPPSRSWTAAAEAGVNVHRYGRRVSDGGTPETVGADRDRRRQVAARTPGARRISCWQPSAEADGTPSVGRGALPQAHLAPPCEDSLRRLRTEYIDLYQTHGPDPATPVDETLRALESLVRQRQGALHRLLELSGMAVGRRALDQRPAPGRVTSAPATLQPPYRAIEDEIVPLCQEHGVG